MKMKDQNYIVLPKIHNNIFFNIFKVTKAEVNLQFSDPLIDIFFLSK
jgi:hypothetical protein